MLCFFFVLAMVSPSLMSLGFLILTQGRPPVKLQQPKIFLLQLARH